MNRNLLIDGKLLDTGTRMGVVNPALGTPFIDVARGSPAEAITAIAAAKRAFASWSAQPTHVRQAAVAKLADALEQKRDALVEALVSEQGKPLSEARIEFDFAVQFARFFAKAELPVEVVQDDSSFHIQVEHRPLGVVLGITPWNFPLLIAVYKMAPAVVLGNTFLLKPAPTTPVTSLMLGEIAAGIFPPGVVNVLTDANDLGTLLTQHPDIAKISFTGSTATGRKVFASAAPTLKRVTLELGGNDACIILDDADIDAIAPKIFGAATFNCAQVCIAIKRVYAPKNMYRRVVDALADLAERAVIGNGLKEGTQVGPLQNAAQYAKAKHFLEVAKHDGQIASGGSLMDGDGYFVKPTVVANVPDSSPLVREEQFVPILPVLSYENVEEAIARANDTEYGLGASIWSSDVPRARKAAGKLNSGTIWINQHLHFGPHVPLAGAKQSGIGIEFSAAGLAEYSQTTVVSLAR
jgi:acyl-CoA reductase-like NAD-dependent aldehyde dehydrogenase